MKFSTKFDRMLPALVMVGDLILLLLILIGFRWLSDIETILTLDVFKLFVLNTLIYLLFIGRNSVMLHLRIVRLDQIVRNIFQRSVLLAAIGIPSTYLILDDLSRLLRAGRYQSHHPAPLAQSDASARAQQLPDCVHRQ